MSSEQVGPTALGRVVIILFIVALLAGAGFFFKDFIFPSGQQVGDVDLDAFQQTVEAPDTAGITTVNEYSYVPAEKLPPVQGTSAYKWDENDKVVEFPINVWIGWLPIVAANHGFSPNEDSIFYKDHGFKVNLRLIDDPVVARDSFAAGESHVLWGTLDMMVLFAGELMKDSRTAPRIFQQIDWSNGGDGIVVRDSISSVADLRGKTVVYAQNSPSQYFLNNLLLNAGIQPSEVNHRYTADAFQAAAAFVSDKSIDACVTWAPDIYNIPDRVAGTKILTTTVEANKLIADVWAARADFANDHPEIIRGLVEGIFKGMEQLKNDTFKSQAYSWMADGYGFAVDEVQAMAADAHSTNFAENKGVFPEPEQPGELRAHLEEHHLRLPRARAARNPGALRRGHGLLGAAGARLRGHVQGSEGRVPHHLCAHHLLEGARRSADPHPDHPHQLLPEFGEPRRACARRAGQRRAGLALRPQRHGDDRKGRATGRSV